MLDHMHPKELTCQYVNGRRGRQQKNHKRTYKEDAAPEPAIPPGFTLIRRSKDSLGIFLRLYFSDEYTPATEVQDFGNKTSKQHKWWKRPPICINPDIHVLPRPSDEKRSDQPHHQGRNYGIVP